MVRTLSVSMNFLALTIYVITKQFETAFEASIIEIDKPGLELFLYKLMKYINAYVSS